MLTNSDKITIKYMWLKGMSKSGIFTEYTFYNNNSRGLQTPPLYEFEAYIDSIQLTEYEQQLREEILTLNRRTQQIKGLLELTKEIEVLTNKTTQDTVKLAELNEKLRNFVVD